MYRVLPEFTAIISGSVPNHTKSLIATARDASLWLGQSAEITFSNIVVLSLILAPPRF